MEYSLPLCLGLCVDNEYESELPVPLDVFTAASIGNTASITQALKISPMVLKKCNKGGWTALMYAAYCGHLDAVKLLHSQGASVHARTEAGCTALMLAAMCGHANVVAALISFGSLLEVRDNKTWTAVYHAVHARQGQVLQLLLEAGANANACERINGESPLHLACSSSDQDVAVLLLCHGADPLLQDYFGKTALSIAITKQNTAMAEAVVRAVIKNGAGSQFPSGLKIEDKLNSTEHSRDTLQQLLADAGVEEYFSLFQEQAVNMQIFLALTDKDLKECGVAKLGPRRKMTALIARWHSNAPLVPRTPQESAYADRLELELQEATYKLEQASRENRALGKKLQQEQHLRASTESLVVSARSRLRQCYDYSTQLSRVLTKLYSKVLLARDICEGACVGGGVPVTSVAGISDHRVHGSDTEIVELGHNNGYSDTGIANFFDTLSKRKITDSSVDCSNFMPLASSSKRRNVLPDVVYNSSIVCNNGKKQSCDIYNKQSCNQVVGSPCPYESVLENVSCNRKGEYSGDTFSAWTNVEEESGTSNSSNVDNLKNFTLDDHCSSGFFNAAIEYCQPHFSDRPNVVGGKINVTDTNDTHQQSIIDLEDLLDEFTQLDFDKVTLPADYRQRPPHMCVPKLGAPLKDCLMLLQQLVMLSDPSVPHNLCASERVSCDTPVSHDVETETITGSDNDPHGLTTKVDKVDPKVAAVLKLESENRIIGHCVPQDTNTTKRKIESESDKLDSKLVLQNETFKNALININLREAKQNRNYVTENERNKIESNKQQGYLDVGSARRCNEPVKDVHPHSMLIADEGASPKHFSDQANQCIVTKTKGNDSKFTSVSNSVQTNDVLHHMENNATAITSPLGLLQTPNCCHITRTAENCNTNSAKYRDKCKNISAEAHSEKGIVYKNDFLYKRKLRGVTSGVRIERNERVHTIKRSINNV